MRAGRRARTAGPRARVLVALALLGGAARAAPPDSCPLPSSSDRPQLEVQQGHSGAVTAIALSDEGCLAATGSEDGTARFWEAATGRELLRLENHRWGSAAIALTPEGHRLLHIVRDGYAALVDTTSGRERRILAGPAGAVTAVTIARDGALAATGSSEGTVRVWSLSCGDASAPTFDVRVAGSAVRCLAFSPEADALACGFADGTLRIVPLGAGCKSGLNAALPSGIHALAYERAGSGLLAGLDDGSVWALGLGGRCDALRRIEPPTGAPVLALAAAPRGTYFAAAGGTHPARVLDGVDGRAALALGPYDWPATSVATAGHSAFLLLGGRGGELRLWDLRQDREVERFDAPSAPVLDVGVSAAGDTVLARSGDGSVHLWSLGTGRQCRRIRHPDFRVERAAIDADGWRVATTDTEGRLRILEVAGGTVEQEAAEPAGPGQPLVFLPSGRHLVTADGDGTLTVRDARSLAAGTRCVGHRGRVLALAASGSGEHLASSGEDRTVRVWETASGREVGRFVVPRPSPTVDLSPDGRWVLAASDAREISLWNVADARLLQRLPRVEGALGSAGHTRPITDATFSPDGARVLTCSEDGTAILYAVASGLPVHRLQGHRDDVTAAVFAREGRFAFTASLDQTVRLWDAVTGERACVLVSMRDGAWAAFEPDGRWDAHNGGDFAGLNWIQGGRRIGPEQYKERYFDPGCLAKRMGFSEEALRDVDGPMPGMYPDVRASLKPGCRIVAKVRLEDQGGGIGRVTVLVNGKEAVYDAAPELSARGGGARGGGARGGGAAQDLEVDLTNDPRVVPGQKNEIEIRAYNEDGTLRSRGLKLDAPETGAASRKPHLWAIVCGVSEYASEALRLRFAAKDAQDVAFALQLAGDSLYTRDRVHLQHLGSPAPAGGKPATLANLRAAFEAARGAHPDDVLVVYLAGHGAVVGGVEGDFHYLTTEATTLELADPAERAESSLSTVQLVELINSVPAAKHQVLVLDTCASGRLIEQLSAPRAPPGAQARALDALKDRTGMFVLAGCAADKSSYESSRFEQGLLTYALLQNFSCGCEFREGQFVDVLRLLAYAQEKVPVLAQEAGVGGVQQPLVSQRAGGRSFDIGRLTEEQRARIPLAQPKPVFVRSSLQDEALPKDTLRLGRALDNALRTAKPQAGGRAPHEFLPTEEMRGAYQVAGRYATASGTTKVKAVLLQDGETRAALEVEGRSGTPEEIAALAEALLQKALAALPAK